MLRSVAVFLPAVCTGILLLHLLWDESKISALLVKLFMGIGVGLGLGSLLYFLYLLVFAGSHTFLFLQSVILVTLLVLAILLKKMRIQVALPRVRMNYWQIALLAVVLLAVAFSSNGALTIWRHRPSGTFDAYIIYNRTARFIYRGQANWLLAFSTKLDPVFHADYPLLMPLSIASSWVALGHESTQVPRVLSGMLLFGCAGLFASGLAIVKSVPQAGVGLLILLNTPLFLVTGASQTADVPLAFLILATAILICLYASRQAPGLLVLAGLTSGLAAWTKNEGLLFIVVTGASLFVGFLKSGVWPRLGHYLLGVFFPLAVITYFKLFLAPPNDLLGGGLAGAIRTGLDWQRHLTILGQYGQELISFGQSWIGVGPVLLAYALIFGWHPGRGLNRSAWIVLTMVALQLVGHYFVYLITPHSISWQLESSLNRLWLQVYLPVLFLLFIALRDVSALWDPRDIPKPPATAA